MSKRKLAFNDRYKTEEILGRGQFGVVRKATDTVGNRIVAIKKIRMSELGADGHPKDGVEFTAIREIKILQELRHENVIQLVDVYLDDTVYLVMEFLLGDLKEVVMNGVVMEPGHVKQYLLQTLAGVEYLHNNWVIHRDLKPENLLISAQGVVKVSDFGLSKSYGSPDAVMTNEVVTLWYRAPELLYGARQYGPGIDVWATGCIFAELMLKAPLFPGDGTNLDELAKIFAVLGTPPENEWAGVVDLPKYVPFNPAAPVKRLSEIFTAATDDTVDLLSKMIQLIPSKRLTTTQCLAHPYFKEEPAATEPFLLPLDAIKNKKKGR